jgi:hypothetical protein
MQSSGIIDLAIGMAFVFGVTAAVSSVVTELIARFLGLRGAYLLRGLRELLDGKDATTDVAKAAGSYNALKKLIARQQTATAASDARAAASDAPNDQGLQNDARAAEHAAEQAPARPDKPSGPETADATAEHWSPSATGALLGSPILRSQGMTGQISGRTLTLKPATRTGRPATLAASAGMAPWQDRRSLPSYIPARSFAEAVVDLVVPDAAGQTTMTTVQNYVNALPDELSALKPSLQALAKNAGDDISAFRTSVEHWYDDHMDRVSGWYKRHVAKITLVVGAGIVLLLNVNALTIGRTLYTDSTVNAAVSSVAARSTLCPAATTTDGSKQQACLTNLQAQLSAAAQAGLPIGWGTVRDCAPAGTSCNWWDKRGIFSRHGGSGWQLALVLIGFLITIAALVPGARFWFGLLAKLGSLRTTGPKPATPAT